MEWGYHEGGRSMESQPRLSYASLAPSRATVLDAVWCCDSSCLTACVLGVFTAVAVGSQSPGNLLSQKRIGVTNDLWKHWGNFLSLCLSLLSSFPALPCLFNSCLFSILFHSVAVDTRLCPFPSLPLFPHLSFLHLLLLP